MQDAGMQTGVSLRREESGEAAAAGADGSPAAGTAGGEMYEDDGGYGAGALARPPAGSSHL